MRAVRVVRAASLKLHVVFCFRDHLAEMEQVALRDQAAAQDYFRNWACK